MPSPLIPSPPPEYGLYDSSWTDDQWQQLLLTLVDSGMASWKDVTTLVLGHINPPQVGTSLASSEGFKRRYGEGKTMRLVMDWFYSQTGRCKDCGSRFELQADHVEGREQFTDKLDADFIENMTLRCRRCNVIRRPSHDFGGLTHLTAESALMWILLVIRPRTFEDFKRLCRLYGMTMADIRMQEAWAMAHWLSRAYPPAYGIEDDHRATYDLILWPDGAVTRIDAGDSAPPEARRLYAGVPGDSVFGFIAEGEDGRNRLYEYPVSFIPFSSYDLGPRPPQSLALVYSVPNRKTKVRGKLRLLPPRGLKLILSAVRRADQCFHLRSAESTTALPEVPGHGKLYRAKLVVAECRMEAHDREPHG